MAQLPTGTVTFLYTDIEGSTRHLQADPASFRRALKGHDAILGQVVAGHGGTIFRNEGDGVCAAFERATDAVTAAVEAQRALGSRDWGNLGQLKVRIALQTGDVEPFAGDYYGPTLHRCARLRAAAHGGQILLGAPTAQLVQDSLPTGVELVDLGERRLRDLLRSERVFQLGHPELPADFPPLRTLEVHPHNLPLQLTSFIGREFEMSQVHHLLDQHRLVTVTGPGGAGKTRLALQLAADLLDMYPDGVWLVEMGTLAEPGLVAERAASTLSIIVRQNEDPVAELAQHLSQKRLLLLLDNCERMAGACGELAKRLLADGPWLRILSTSRKPLGVAGEEVWAVPPMRVPAADVDAREVLQSDAVRLFRERARSVQPEWELHAADAAAVAQICRQLDGLPLALELAAARMVALSPPQIAARLQDHFRLLKSNRLGIPDRQQTLDALVGWSHDLLTESQRPLFRRLSVFSGSWSLEAAEEVCAGGMVERPDLLELLVELVGHSLVRSELLGRERRYRMLETIRSYAADRLQDARETGDVRLRHAHYYLHLAEETAVGLWGHDPTSSLERLELDHENMRAALRWARDTGNAEMGLRLATSIWRFWAMRGHLAEGLKWLEERLEDAAAADAALRAKALDAAGDLTRIGGGLERAEHHYRESLRLRQATQDRWGMAVSMNNLGVVAYNAGDLKAAWQWYQKALEIFRELGDKRGLVYTLNNLGTLAQDTGHWEEAETYHRESLAVSLELGDPQGMAISLLTLGQAALRRGDVEAARSLLRESLTLSRRIGDRLSTAAAFNHLAAAAAEEGDLPTAAGLYQESLSIYRGLGDKVGTVGSVYHLAWLDEQQGRDQEAMAHAREGLTLSRELGAILHILRFLAVLTRVAAREGQYESAIRLGLVLQRFRDELGLEASEYHVDLDKRFLAGARRSLGPARLAVIGELGRALSLEEAVELGLRLEPAERSGIEANGEALAPLTERQREVALLIARGRSNREIARALVITERTAATHVQNILEKLGFRSRAQIASWVAEKIPLEPQDD